jgi:hypothetical protein
MIKSELLLIFYVTHPGRDINIVEKQVLYAMIVNTIETTPINMFELIKIWCIKVVKTYVGDC